MTAPAHRDHQLYVVPMREGRPAALGEIYPLMRDNFSARYAKLGLTKPQGEELFQQSVTAMLVNFTRPDFTLTCPIEAFLTGVFNNKVREYWRKNRQRAVRTGELPDISTEPLANQQLIERSQREVKWHLLLRRSFAELGERCRRLLSLTEAKVPAPEIAERLEMTNANAVYQARLRCRDAWARLIEKDPAFPACKPNRW